MSKNGQVLLTLNPLGYLINSKDVDRILYPVTEVDKTESEHVAYFFRLALSESELSVPLVQRYARACEAMTNIGGGSFQDKIKEKLIETLASAKRCYSYGESLACIELCALHGEMLANFLCIINKDVISANNIVEKLEGKAKQFVKENLKKDDFYDGLYQKDRISWLLLGGAIDQDDFNALDVVHENRKKYFHHWEQHHQVIDEEALGSLRSISSVAAKKLELINNVDNINKIRKYMQDYEKK